MTRPVARSFDVGGAFESIWPDLIRINDPTVRAIEQRFTESTAPGLTRQANLLHYVAFGQLHTPGSAAVRPLNYKFFYHFYQDWDQHRYSFQRFEADLDHRPRLDENDGFRIRGRVSVSEANTGQQVPFYLQQTLGGANMQKEDTLRGFRNYRFRDLDLILLQSEYARELKGPLKFLLFYDVGKVAPRLSDFDLGRLGQTWGLGLTVTSKKKEDVLLRFYIAFGSGEGSHSSFGPGPALTGHGDRLVR